MLTEFDKSKFDAALREFRRHSRKALGQVLREQARGVVKQIAERTPPGGPNTSGRAAKQRGEAAVVSDILKIMEKAGPKRKKRKGGDEDDERGDHAAALFDITAAAAISNPEAVHKRYRNNRGRVRREIHPKIKVRAGDLARIIKKRKSMVGFLASGWRTAAQKFGVKLAAWITRHTGDGSASEKSDAASVEVVATNSVGYADKAANMDKIVQASLDAQAGNMRRQVEHFIAKAAKRAGFHS
ncbi:MAG: hypothetical protein IAE97_07080 [Chthoniobacterales bacterium]|nr:hypothetical protein [Chthoniobacterales bacterium]